MKNKSSPFYALQTCYFVMDVKRTSIDFVKFEVDKPGIAFEGQQFELFSTNFINF